MKIPAFVWIILIVVVGFGGLYLLSNTKTKTVSYADKNLPVEVEVFIDFNCPHCATFEPYAKDLQETYGDKVDVQMKNLPILTTGQATDTSFEYATAFEAARLQDKGDEYSEALFKWITFRKGAATSPYSYTTEESEFFSSGPVDTVKLAERLDLDLEKFSKDVESTEVRDAVLEQKRSAIERMGPASTPAVFIYGEYFELQTLDDPKNKVGEIIAEIESRNSN